jgi:signal transduction histidine kinase
VSGEPSHKASLTELVELLDEKLAELRRIVRGYKPDDEHDELEPDNSNEWEAARDGCG